MFGALMFAGLGAVVDAPVLWYVLCVVYGIWRTYLDIDLMMSR